MITNEVLNRVQDTKERRNHPKEKKKENRKLVPWNWHHKQEIKNYKETSEDEIELISKTKKSDKITCEKKIILESKKILKDAETSEDESVSQSSLEWTKFGLFYKLSVFFVKQFLQ